MGYLGMLYATGIMSSILLNGIVILVFARKKRPIQYIAIIHISMAASNVLLTVLGFPLELHAYINDDLISPAACQMVGFSVTFTGLVIFFHLFGLILERYTVILKPWKARVWLEVPLHSLYVVAPSWLFGFCWALLPIIGWSSYERENGSKYRCSINLSEHNFKTLSYACALLLLCFFVPVAIITVCFISIRREVKRMGKQAIRASLNKIAVIRSHARDIKYTKVVFILTFSFVGAWCPYALTLVCLSIGKNIIPSLLVNICSLFAKSSTLFNPIIYIIFMKKFRTALKKVLTF